MVTAFFISRIALRHFNLSSFLFLLAFLCFSSSSSAVVTGVCSNCHTMHNSQNGTSVARTGTNVGWDGSNVLTGGNPSNPLNQLLVTDCVGCHTSTTSATIINFGGSKIPIVFNTGGYPSNPLAGGNYYWVAQGHTYDGYGHNVYGISEPDEKLQWAPGSIDTCGTTECHSTLAASNNSKGKPGCQGCHFRVFHHTKDNADSSNTGYRFLWGHQVTGTTYTAYVVGKEDPLWEQNAGPTSHNWYKGTQSSYYYYPLKTTHTITAFCSGCHTAFHGLYDSLTGEGMGSASPWMRHPTDILLPATGEYSVYKPWESDKYSVEAPVAWLDPLNPQQGQAVVMCLSCHKPHGSPYPDMLRWDYNTMIAGTTSTSQAGKGCFVCHTAKDGL